jgi:alanine or glycine:cation symporter, AGCS family
MTLLYIVGALAVILKNADNIIPSFLSIFTSIFTGTAAVGGFLGASFAYAFTRGVNRGLYSNEAGQGSAAIAHAAAKADEPVSEGMVSILEPFIDTLVVCTVTGLVILASGAWTQKFDNVFQRADMKIVQGIYSQENPDHIHQLGIHLRRGSPDTVQPFNGTLRLIDGRLAPESELTVIHARSIAEDLLFQKAKAPFTGDLTVQNGQLTDASIQVSGRSLVHSAVLTAEAFKKGYLGAHGQYVVSIGLLLFAFTTIVGFSYYGDRAVTYLLGSRYVFPYRVLYIAAHFAAALIDTTIIWSLAAVAIVVMTVPNLFAILMLHKDMKQSVKEYWVKFRKEHPEEVKKRRISFVD